MKEIPPELLERIKKMMRLAEDKGASEGEVDNALRFAKKIMAEYDLSEADIILDEARPDAINDVVEMDLVAQAGDIHEIEKVMARVIDVVCSTKHYFTSKYVPGPKGRPSFKRVAVLYGMARDVAVGKYLFVELMVTLRAMARNHFGKGWSDTHRSYGKGFAMRLHERALAMKHEPVVGSSTAIVLAKDALLNRYANEKLNLVVGRAKKFRMGDAAAYAKGGSDANNISLSTNGIHGSKGGQGCRTLEGR